MNPSKCPTPHSGLPARMSVSKSCDWIKEEFSSLQAQYDGLKLKHEKLAQQKREMQEGCGRWMGVSQHQHVECLRQTEVVRQLNVVCAKVMPLLPPLQQQHVAVSVEMANQVAQQDLNLASGGLSVWPQPVAAEPFPYHLHGLPGGLDPHQVGLQQVAAEPLPYHLHGLPGPLDPHQMGLQPTIFVPAASGFLSPAFPTSFPSIPPHLMGLQPSISPSRAASLKGDLSATSPPHMAASFKESSDTESSSSYSSSFNV